MLNNFIDRIKLSFRKDKELYFSLYQILGFYPHNISYYKMALMHKSIMHRNSKGKPVNNERLEFLGDAVLDAVVGDIVYQHFPGKREGFLTNTRSKLVQRDTLNKLAQEMGINQLVLSMDSLSLSVAFVAPLVAAAYNASPPTTAPIPAASSPIGLAACIKFKIFCAAAVDAMAVFNVIKALYMVCNV